MSLEEALARETRPKKGPLCTVGATLAKLEGSERAALLRYLADPEATHVGIARALQAEGHRVAESAVARHRTGLCLCTRPDAR